MKFNYNSRIIEQLGSDLITSSEMAISELIKNSYDAFAPEVGIHFIENKKLATANFLTEVPPEVYDIIIKSLHDDNLIVIDDNGEGMNYEALQKGFFTIGTSLKENTSPSSSRPVLGNKGLGRLASQRLGHTMYLETTAEDCDKIYMLEIKWSEFIKSNHTDAPEHSFSKKSKKGSYTRIWILTHDSFEMFIDDKRLPLFIDSESPDFNSDIFLKEQLLSTINFLYSPFGEKLNDFIITFWKNNTKIKFDFNNDAIKLAESISRFSLNKNELKCSLILQPWYLERIHMRLLGGELFSTWRRTHEEYAEILSKYQSHYTTSLILNIPHDEIISNIEEELAQETPHHITDALGLLTKIMPIRGEVYSFKREAALFSMAVEAAVKNKLIPHANNISRASLLSFLDNHNGIKLYRNKYRIATLGDKDSDWLKLQQARTKGQQFFRFELGNSIGYVTIDDIEQKFIRETSSRQDIRQTPTAIVLKAFLDYVFNFVFYNLHRKAYYLTADILGQEGILTKDTTEELKEQLSDSDKFVKNLKKQIVVFDKKLQLISKNIELDTPQKIGKVQRAFHDLDTSFHSMSEDVNKTVAAISNTNNIIKIIEAKEEAIKVESYNNYKLMANGLITEVLTHELHALVSKVEDRSEYKNHLDVIDNYLLEEKAKDIYLNNFLPINNALKTLSSRLDEMGNFYQFLEKTFVKKGTSDDFETQDLYSFFTDLKKRLEKRLDHILFDFSSVEGKTCYVPKGVLIHIFYNLIDNSLYWIAERKQRAKHDDSYKFQQDDYIKINYVSPAVIQFWDSGTGVFSNYENTLFYPLESGKKNGRGMGLYIVKKLLESFDGNITLLPDRNSHGNRYIFEVTFLDENNE